MTPADGPAREDAGNAAAFDPGCWLCDPVTGCVSPGVSCPTAPRDAHPAPVGARQPDLFEQPGKPR